MLHSSVLYLYRIQARMLENPGWVVWSTCDGGGGGWRRGAVIRALLKTLAFPLFAEGGKEARIRFSSMFIAVVLLLLMFLLV